jgi:hypothetical protein
METPDIQDANKDKPAIKKQILILLAAFCALCLYFALSWMIDIRYASKEEERYSKELLSKAQTAGDILSSRVKNMANGLDIFRRIYLTEFAEEKRGIGSVIDLFEEELNSFPELVSLSYMNATSELVYARGIEGDEGEAAVNAAIDWSKEYWSRLGPDDEKPFYTPIKKNGRYFMQGVLFPVAVDEKVAGGLIAVTDAGTVVSKSLELADIQEGTAILLIDTTGEVISSSGNGESMKSPDASFITKDFMKKALSSQNGCLTLAVQAKGTGKTKLSGQLMTAWQQIRLGSKDAVIVITSPAEDAVMIFKKARFTHMILEFIFAVLVAMVQAVFLLRNRKPD